MKYLRRWQLIVLTGVLFASVFGFATLKFTSTFVTKTHAAQTRNPLTWPFAVNSPWNMPIGSGARYVPASIGSRGFGVDTDWFITTKASDPLTPTYVAPTFGQGRCSGTAAQPQAQWHPEAAGPKHVPSDLIIGDAGPGFTPNNSLAMLEPDGKTIDSYNVAARCQAGGPFYGLWFGQQDLYSDGVGGGAHGASQLSGVGGSIRKGELFDNNPIHHALKIDLWGNWLHYDAASGGKRWPASLADSGAANQYKGSNPALVMGSLLALPPSVTAESLGLTSAAGKKLFAALQNYGAYVVDDSGWDFNYLCVGNDATDEYKQVTGHTIDQDSALTGDLGKMIGAVNVIDNNNPDSTGGGGTPRALMAPEFGAPIDQPTPAPTQQPTAQPTVAPKPTVTSTPTPPVVNNTLPKNNAGISNDSRLSMANHDGANNSYSLQALQKAGFAPGKTVTLAGVSFTLPNTQEGKADNYQIASFATHKPGVRIGATLLSGSSTIVQQPITLQITPVKGAKTLAFLADATNGPSQSRIIINYSDGSHRAVGIGISDWTLNGGRTAAPMFNNRIAISMPYRNTLNRQSGKEMVTTYLFSVEVALEAGKTITSVTFPMLDSQGRMHFFAVGTK